ncbi:MAG: transporter permease [Thermoleophilia bacterium]|nr:transporter permease [Thermoleophilia bacterium]
MTLVQGALDWLGDPANWRGLSGIQQRLVEHLAITGAVILVAALIALPLGILVGHTRRGRGTVVALTSGVRSIPTLGLLTILALNLGIGLTAPVLALIVLAIPPLLAGAYAGIESVSVDAVDASRGIGMTEWQLVRAVEVPLALPVIVGGLRSATLQVVATATLAAYVADAGLGRFLFSGLKQRQYSEMLGGAILVATLALVLETALALMQRVLTTVPPDTGRP